MFARVSTYSGADSDRLREGFERVTQPLEQIDGFSHAYFLIDRSSGKAMSITLWETEDALRASAAKADELRQQGADAGGAAIDSVESYEVALELGASAAAG